MTKIRIGAVLVLIVGLLVGYFVYNTERAGETSRFPFSYGLDLDGGTRLVYRADVSQIPAADLRGSMDALSATIERRVNMFGVSEAIVSTESGSVFGAEENDQRLTVELPGITDVSQAIDMIGETPLLEFRLENDKTQSALLLAQVSTSTEEIKTAVYNAYAPTGLSGGQLKRASIVFGGGGVATSPTVLLQFDADGAELFATITKDNIGKSMAIFLDGELLSAPVIQAEIFGGEATITGNFVAEEARDLAQNLNLGALPVPIELIETNTVGPSLGHITLEKGVDALSFAFVIISAFLILWYRLPGIVAVVSLAMYVALSLALFKLIPVTLTASGLAGFILSLGMAVDANVLIFSRISEELKAKKTLVDAIHEGFSRAWSSIRDGNVTSIMAAVILYWMSDASVVKGFAFVFGMGVLLSMVSAIVVSRTLLLALVTKRSEKHRVLFGTGFTKDN
jgi:protein-export membrane protein SecD